LRLVLSSLLHRHCHCTAIATTAANQILAFFFRCVVVDVIATSITMVIVVSISVGCYRRYLLPLLSPLSPNCLLQFLTDIYRCHRHYHCHRLYYPNYPTVIDSLQYPSRHHWLCRPTTIEIVTVCLTFFFISTFLSLTCAFRPPF
jgi:hypothetical protein